MPVSPARPRNLAGIAQGVALLDWPRICYTDAIMKIFLRIPKGWSKPVTNKNKETCDIDGAKLWIGPGDHIYCDLEHDPKVLEAAANEEP